MAASNDCRVLNNKASPVDTRQVCELSIGLSGKDLDSLAMGIPSKCHCTCLEQCIKETKNLSWRWARFFTICHAMTWKALEELESLKTGLNAERDTTTIHLTRQGLSPKIV